MNQPLRSCLATTLAAVASSVILSFSAASASAQSTVTVVEYYNVALDSYFITSRSTEIAAIDALPQAFIRTGVTFTGFAANANVAGTDAVCRYYIKSTTPPISSHFYGLAATDCALIAAASPAGFTYEGLDFAVHKTVAGSCPAAAPTPIYRLLRLGDSGRNPNHRYTTSLASYNQFIGQGWTGEGIAFCTAASSAATLKVGTDVASCKTTPPVVATANYTVPTALAANNCSLDTQKSWVRTFADTSYLWATQSPKPAPSLFSTIETYFDGVLFKPTDHYSWLDDAASTYDSFSGAPTIRLGYEVGLARWDVSNLVIRRVEANTAASRAGLTRGTLVSAINGEAVTGTLSAPQLAALFPTASGTTTQLTVKLRGSNIPTTVSLLADLATSGIETTVDNARVFTRPDGTKVGYLAFHSFVDQSTAELTTALRQFKSAGVKDVLLDLRYNGGGLVSVSNELSSMLGGDRVRGQVFAKTRFTERQAGTADSTFFDVDATPADARLNLPRLFVLVTNRTASASELVINSLRPFAEVVIIGSTTYGKPVGSYLHPFSRSGNCGKMYAMIGFESVNACDAGGYYNGIAPTCFALDDLSNDLGDANESIISAALRYVDTGTCATSATTQSELKRNFVPIESIEKAHRTGAFLNGRLSSGDRRPPIAPEMQPGSALH